MQNMMSKFG